MTAKVNEKDVVKRDENSFDGRSIGSLAQTGRLHAGQRHRNLPSTPAQRRLCRSAVSIVFSRPCRRWLATPPPSRFAVPRRRLADGSYPDRTDWWDYILSLPAPRVVVVQDVATRPGLGSLLGAVHVNILRPLAAWGRHQRFGARHSGGGGPRVSPLCRQCFGLARLCSHRRIWRAGGNRRLENSIRRFAARRLSRRPIHSAGHRRADSGGGGENRGRRAGAHFSSASLRTFPWKNCGRRWPGQNTEPPSLYVPLRHPLSLFHHRHLPDHLRGGRDQPGAHAGGFVSADQHSRGGGGHVLFRHAAGADRKRHHRPV